MAPNPCLALYEESDTQPPLRDDLSLFLTDYNVDSVYDIKLAKKADVHYSLAGRRATSHLFKDVRSASVARLRNANRARKYYNFLRVKEGQLNKPHYILEPNMWDRGTYDPPADFRTQPIHNVNKRDLYRLAQENLPPRTRMPSTCCRICQPEALVWARERNLKAQREFRRMFPNKQAFESLRFDEAEIDHDVMFRKGENWGGHVCEDLALQYCYEYQQMADKDQDASHGALVDRAVEKWEAKQLLGSALETWTAHDEPRMADWNWEFVDTRDIFSDIESEFDMLSDL
jgi:hypothetical protein